MSQNKEQPDPFALRAVGCFQGRIKIGPSYINFITEGWEAQVAAVGPQTMCALLANPNQLEGFYTVWPKPKGVELRTFNPKPHPNMTPGVMSIVGSVGWIGDGKVTVKISDRHHLFLNVKGFLPNVAQRQIWRIDAVREGDEWAIVDAQLLKDGSKAKKKKAKASEVKPEGKKLDPKLVDNVIPIRKEVKPVEAKSLEITVKFAEQPEAVPIDDGKVQVELTNNGLIVRAQFKNKTWKKNAGLMESYADWVAAITGKIASIKDGVIELDGAGCQIFEKKPKGAKAG